MKSSLSEKTKLLAIVGPTASGKTAIAIELAKQYRGEIICADSRTIYKGFDTGTAKPTMLEREGIPHYGLDVIEPYESYSAADFKNYTSQLITEIQERGNLPILVGGSGLYIDGVLYDYDFGAPADANLRVELQSMEIDELQQRIISSGIEMPENENNKRYLIRAIEQGGINRKKHPLPKSTTVIGVDPGRDILEQRIKDRSKKMVEAGVLEEVRLIDEDFGWDAPIATGNIYCALRPIVEGSTEDLEGCLEDSVRLDMQLAKRQRSWFKRNKDIRWFIDAQSVVL